MSITDNDDLMPVIVTCHCKDVVIVGWEDIVLPGGQNRVLSIKAQYPFIKFLDPLPINIFKFELGVKFLAVCLIILILGPSKIIDTDTVNGAKRLTAVDADSTPR